ncbi:MAG: twin-arginine translocation pathway signal protein, partial [Acidobacteria bacterium]|nr:twin-arginine translocation pathway signal protein [Acidobacteriota bacterium]
MDRRAFFQGAIAAAGLASARRAPGAEASDLKAVLAQVEKRHGGAVERLQEWVRQPSIAAENRGMAEGCDLMMRLLRDAGFDRVTKIPTDRHPGVFATLDAGAPRTLGVYFMYDVKQVDPSEWSSPPWEA